MPVENLLQRALTWLVCCSTTAAVLLLGARTYSPQSSSYSGHDQTSLTALSLHLDQYNASLTSCSPPSMAAGIGQKRKETLVVFTNALIVLPACDVSRKFILEGTTVDDVGPAVTFTSIKHSDISLEWSGFVADDPIALTLQGGASGLLSFTNDLATDSEDRNLRISQLKMVTQ